MASAVCFVEAAGAAPQNGLSLTVMVFEREEGYSWMQGLCDKEWRLQKSVVRDCDPTNEFFVPCVLRGC